jgi:hypothetical protein
VECLHLVRNMRLHNDDDHSEYRIYCLPPAVPITGCFGDFVVYGSAWNPRECLCLGMVLLVAQRLHQLIMFIVTGITQEFYCQS